jgi:ATP-binding cassette subfamily B protein
MKLGGLYSKLYNMNYASFDDIPEELIPQGADVGQAT